MPWSDRCRYTARIMEQFLLHTITSLLDALALPEVGLSAIFVVALVSATLLPMGSEPVVFAYVSVAPHMFWAAVVVATAGNTIGGATSYWLGLGAARAVDTWRARQDDADSTADAGDRPMPPSNGPPVAQSGVSSTTQLSAPVREPGGKWHDLGKRWLLRVGPPALLLSWLPVVGDPLCAVAGYLRMSFWPCVACMAIGKFLRYTVMTAALLWGVKFFM